MLLSPASPDPHRHPADEPRSVNSPAQGDGGKRRSLDRKSMLSVCLSVSVKDHAHSTSKTVGTLEGHYPESGAGRPVSGQFPFVDIGVADCP